MGKKKNHLKLPFVIVSIVALVAILIIAGVIIWAVVDQPDKTFNEVTEIETEALASLDSFYTQYDFSDITKINGNASLQTAKESNSKALEELEKAAEDFEKIKKVTEEEEKKYSGEKLEWITNVNECYNQRISMVAEYKKVLESERKYFEYYEEYERLTEAEKRFYFILEKKYLVQLSRGDTSGAKNSIKEMKKELDSMKTYSENGRSKINYEFLTKYIAWIDSFQLLLDKSSKALSTQSYSHGDQLIKDSEEAGLLLTEAYNQIEKDVDKWNNDNIIVPDKKAIELGEKADKACDEAGSIYEGMYP